MTDHTAAHDDHHDAPPTSFTERWLFTTNHKDIGTLYLIFSLVMFFMGGAMALVIRAELFQPGLQFVDPQFFNSMTTVHALLMVFGAVMPAFVGLANWLIPMMIGAPDMALPRMNNWSFWILPFAFSMLILTLFLPGGAPAGGWTLYPPLVLQTGDAFPFHGLCGPPYGCLVDHGLDQRDRDHHEHARAGHDTAQNATVRVDLADHGLPADCRAMPVLAGAVTMLLTDKYFGYQLLQRGRRR